MPIYPSGSPHGTQQVFKANVSGGPVEVVGQGSGLVRLDFEKPVMASPPTVTISAAEASTSIVGAALVARTDPRYRYLGANPSNAGAVHPDNLLYRPNNITAVSYGVQPWAPEFMTDTDVLEWRTKGQGGKFRLVVDGALATTAYQSGPAIDGNLYLIKVDFGSAAIRRLRIEMTWSTYFGGVFMHPTRGIWTPSRPVGPRVIFLGDSVTEPQGATAYEGYAHVSAKLLGWDDAWASGKGGTGISQATKFSDRVAADVIAYSPDVVVIQDQDNVTATATQQADLATLLTTIKAGLPDVRIVGLGGISMQTSQAGSYQAVNTALRTTYEAAGAIFVDPSATPWIAGTGKSGATTGDGNADYYTGTDGAHPNTAGHDYIGRRLAAELAPDFPLS